MSAFLRYVPCAAELVPLMLAVMTWAAARALNLPPPLIQGAAILALARTRAMKTRVWRCLRSHRLSRRLRLLAALW